MELGANTTEYRSFTLDNYGCKYLLLAGDIGSVGKKTHHEPFTKWLSSTCKNYNLVFWIGGNNEFKGNTIAYGLETMRRFAAHPDMQGKLIVLENDRYDMTRYGYNVTILGCVLWTHILDSQPRTDGVIKGNSKKAHNARNEESLGWIKSEVAAIRREDPKRRILVLTHHAPTGTGSSRPEQDDFNSSTWSAYVNDILGGEGVRGLQPGDVWAFGHTHWSCDFESDGVRVIANQRGGPAADPQATRWGQFPVFEM